MSILNIKYNKLRTTIKDSKKEVMYDTDFIVSWGLENKTITIEFDSIKDVVLPFETKKEAKEAYEKICEVIIKAKDEHQN